MDRPGIGVAIIVLKDNKVLIGKRKHSNGKDTWQFPGGKLDMNESIENCAARETLEESNIKIKNIRKGSFTNDIFSEHGLHYVTLFMVADYDSGEPKVMEPEKCECWEWIEWDKMHRPLFSPMERLLEQGFNPFD